MVTLMRAYDIIKKKRDGEVLRREELAFLIKGHLSGEIPDYQISAFLMASFLKGLNREETLALTDLMLRSGDVIELSEMEDPMVDKHSTGGVGDKVSIILAPLLAAADVVVPMISGRGLGHTGGTLDKLDSIPGFRTDLGIIDFRNNLWEIGVSMTGQTDDLAPADKLLYALRDATATIESIPLIAASILSKKLAEGLDGLVLDVKAGSGAFMKSTEDADELAGVLVDISSSLGVKTVALITDMDEPLGKTVGNALEVRECINFLKGEAEDDLYEVTLTTGAWMLYLAEDIIQKARENPAAPPPSIALNNDIITFKKAKLDSIIRSGKALEKFLELLKFHNGNTEIIPNPGLLPVAESITPVTAASEGYICRVDAEKVGTASMLLGAGRLRVEDDIDHAAGITLQRKSGAYVKKGDAIAVLHYNDDRNLSEASRLVESAFETGPEAPGPREMIRKVVLPQ